MPHVGPPQLVSIDMTLALGADSYLRRGSAGLEGVFSDPVGRTCLKDFVDVIVNSGACFLMLPSGSDYLSRPPLIEHLSGLQHLPDCASIRLLPAVDLRVWQAFWDTLETLGRDWVSQWFKSQFWNPIVTKHHHPRLGAAARQFTTIPDEGWRVWNEFVDREQLSVLPPLTTTMPGEDYLVKDIQKAGGLASFQYCYAYSVFRRGWQYAEASRRVGGLVSYCPHQFRRRALDAGSQQGWLETAREVFWSWGQCVVHAVETSPDPIEAAQVADWVNGIKANTPRWMDVAALIGRPDTTQTLDDLVDQLLAVARAAAFPLADLHLGTRGLKERLASGVAEMRFQALSANEILEANPSASPASQSEFLKMGRPGLTERDQGALSNQSASIAIGHGGELREYNRILRILANMARTMELTPRPFHALNEEDLRTFFLVYLNAEYGGQATGETFNGTGKTDLLIRANGTNLLVAECKFWHGEKSLLAAIDQLLAYLAWRDTKAALLIFYRGEGFSAVLKTIAEVLPRHKSWKGTMEMLDETTFQCEFVHPGDYARTIILSLLAFTVPSLRDG